MKYLFFVFALLSLIILPLCHSNGEVTVQTNNGPVTITEINSGVRFLGNGFSKDYYFYNSVFSVFTGNYYSDNNVIICGGQRDTAIAGVILAGMAKGWLMKFSMDNLDTVFTKIVSTIQYPYASYVDRVTFIYQLSNKKIIATTSYNGGAMHQDTKFYVFDVLGNVFYENNLPYTFPSIHGTPPYISSVEESLRKIKFNCWFFWSCSLEPTTFAYACITNNGEIIGVNPPCDSVNCLLSGVKEEKTIKNFSLNQNYPNPFNPVTKINFAIPKSGLVTIKVYNILGKEIKILVNELKNVGSYTIDFNGSELASGVYFYRLTANNFTETKKMILTK